MPALNNPRWEEFCKQKAMGATHPEAYRLAGFNETTLSNRRAYGYRLHRKAEIQARITEIEADLRENGLKRSAIDRDFVLLGLKEVHEKCMQAKPVINKKGEETGEYKFEPSGAVRSLELMGKEAGMFVEHLVLDGLDEELKGMSGLDLRAYVRGVASEVGLRMVEMNAEDKRAYILKHAKSVGLRVEECSEDPDGSETPETIGVSSVH